MITASKGITLAASVRADVAGEKEKRKQKVACVRCKSRNAVKFAKLAASGKAVQTSGVLDFSGNERYEQSAVPKEIGEADEREP